MAANQGPSPAELIEPAPAPELAIVPAPAGRPRGRPRGSKNKPKPPVYVTRDSEAAMRPVVLELAPGCDVAMVVAAFARRRGVGVSVLCGRGALAAVTLRIPTSPSTASTVTLQGRFELLSLSGTVLPSTSREGGAVPPPFSVSLAGANGLVIGGTLAGEMVAADGVVVMAATFGNAEVHRLPSAEADQKEGDGSGGRHQESGLQQEQEQKPVGVAASAGDVVGLAPAGHGGVMGLSGGQPGLVGHYQQHGQMALLAQLTASRNQTNLSPGASSPYYLDRS